MPSPLSVDLRERVVAAVAEGASFHRAAARFGVSVSSASRWSERFRQEGQLALQADGRRPYLEAHRGACRADPLDLRSRSRELFLRELRDALAEQGVQTSTSGLSRFFARHGISRKKGRRTQLSRSART